MVAEMDESTRIQSLENELTEVRTAFDDYMASSKDLEKKLDRKLEDMRTFTERNRLLAPLM